MTSVEINEIKRKGNINNNLAVMAHPMSKEAVHNTWSPLEAIRVYQR